MIEITSRDNPRLRHFRKIRDGSDQAFIFIEGLRLAREALRSPVEVTVAIFSKSFDKAVEFGDLTESIVVPDNVFASLADTKNAQGIVLIAKRPELSKENLSGPTAVFLHRVNNPSNLGAILRTCEAAGVGDVVISKNSADPFSPKALRASMGSALRLNFWTGADFEEVIRWAKAAGMTTTAADISGTRGYRQIDWQKPRLIVFGSEAHGLDKSEIDAMDEVISIPMKNNVESLNLAVSAGIILFEQSTRAS